MPPPDTAALTPMMRQYFELKTQNRDCILFFRLGDFYEMFFDDAITVSKELSLTLTARDCGLPERAPMCGVPHHAAEGYIGKLVQKGYRVAICDQTEDPKTAKGLVKREVTRVVTTGTVLNPALLSEDQNSYVLCVFQGERCFGLAFCDITTGEFLASSCAGELQSLINEIARFKPKEIITNPGFSHSEAVSAVFSTAPLVYDDWRFDTASAHMTLLNHFKVLNLHGYGIEGEKEVISACGALLAYLCETQKAALVHITSLRRYYNTDSMLIDISSRKNLEITRSVRDNTKRGSLYGVIDKTKTSMGARLLNRWLEAPLTDPAAINARLDAVEELVKFPLMREEIRDYLARVNDIERLVGRLACQAASARDLAALKASAACLPEVRAALTNAKSARLAGIFASFDTLSDISALIEAAIEDEPPATVREGGFIKPGASPEIDRLRDIKQNGAGRIAAVEAREREQTGIKSLKIRYNKVFGYCIEITNAYKDTTPAHYIRRQTLANAERYITEELKALEEEIINADERIKNLEYNFFLELREKILSNSERLIKQAMLLARLDCFAALADAADKQRYTRPIVDAGDAIIIKDGRHPVIEALSKQAFIPNDTLLDRGENRLVIITGPNMAGKSTYMRQTAIIVLMAQIGSFVPAAEAQIGVVDRIFTRVGASDDLLTGQSTFMVEMSEVANILNNATLRSLLILDEIGRGTSTYDGLAIAWACLLHIADLRKLGARAMFATHYHELTEIEGKTPGVVNYSCQVKLEGEDILFLRKVLRGSQGVSYGIQVARLAGLPRSVLKKAQTILNSLNLADIAKQKHTKASAQDAAAATLIETPELNENEQAVIDTLLDLNTDSLTPIEALNKLVELKGLLL